MHAQWTPPKISAISRHCEQSEAIQIDFQFGLCAGLLHFVRNDGKMDLHKIYMMRLRAPKPKGEK